MTSTKLTRKQRQDLFSAELTLSRVLRHLKQRVDVHLPPVEREGVEHALHIVWTLYRRVAFAEQRRP